MREIGPSPTLWTSTLSQVFLICNYASVHNVCVLQCSELL